MSTCISQRGEFGSHELDANHVCTYCGVLDEDALVAELHQARQNLAAAEDRYTRLVGEVERHAKEIDPPPPIVHGTAQDAYRFVADRLRALAATAPQTAPAQPSARCPACDHPAAGHDRTGCQYTITAVGQPANQSLRCPCALADGEPTAADPEPVRVTGESKFRPRNLDSAADNSSQPETAPSEAQEGAKRDWRSEIGKILTDHFLFSLNCDHDRGTDTPWCGCSEVDLGSHPSVGEAVQAWVAHVLGFVAALGLHDQERPAGDEHLQALRSLADALGERGIRSAKMPILPAWRAAVGEIDRQREAWAHLAVRLRPLGLPDVTSNPEDVTERVCGWLRTLHEQALTQAQVIMQYSGERDEARRQLEIESGNYERLREAHQQLDAALAEARRELKLGQKAYYDAWEAIGLPPTSYLDLAHEVAEARREAERLRGEVAKIADECRREVAQARRRHDPTALIGDRERERMAGAAEVWKHIGSKLSALLDAGSSDTTAGEPS